MPLILHKELQPAGELGIWRIEEPEAWFRQKLELSRTEQQQFEKLKGRRRVEWLAVRKLVHRMSGREKRGSFLKDEYGKPHLEDSPFDISISHSANLAAAIAAPFSVGIDIQVIVAKIGRLAPRYMRSEELESLKDDHRIEHMHVYWGAKEALYKAYGRRELDFCQNILIKPFPYDPRGGLIRGRIKLTKLELHYEGRYERMDDYILVYARALE
ncbi:MAG: 4'-phosphopantetheinyl transferase superfamily protein [Saprospiraceae bacterium]|nr:4'-phosphopantetheinyl transferase superfamily protein [Saprospiraceae bacterium]